MIIKTRGIILRAIKYSETSIITDIYTEAKGLRSYIISGVRTPKAKISAGILQVMSLVDLVAYDKEEANKLNRIKEIKAAHVYTSLPFDINKSAIGQFMAEVARRTIRESEENAALFHFLFDIFTYLDTVHEGYANLHLSFLLELSNFLGFQPHGDNYTEGSVFDLKEGIFTDKIVGHSQFINPYLSNILRGLIEKNWHRSSEIKINREERRLLLGELLNFYDYHIDNFPDIHSHKILQEVL
jgi:DNA repair protein RecO (recombination protein O)